MGYRGIDSSVKLRCPEVNRAFVIENPLSPPSIERIRETIRNSYNRYIKEGVDINGYTVLETVDTSKYVYNKINFKPEKTYLDYAQELLLNKKKK